MHIDARLRALRGDVASQRKAQEALETARDDWKRTPAIAAALAEMRPWGEGGALGDCAALAALMAGRGGEIASLVRGQIAALAEHPLGQVPFRHQLSPGLAILQLAQAGRAVLSLITYEEHAAIGAESAICFSDGERYECVLAGEGMAEILTIAEDRGDHVHFDRRVVALRRGAALHLRDAREAKRVMAISASLVVLRLSRTPVRPEPSRQFDLASGRLLHRASGDRRESRHELAMALLGRMKQPGATEVLAEIARDRGASDHLRWQALRECLALDTATGFAALTRLAADPTDPLSRHAGPLRAHLVTAHPQLEELSRCPA